MCFLIAQKLARKFLADYLRRWGRPETLRGILARNSREFILFAERMRGCRRNRERVLRTIIDYASRQRLARGNWLRLGVQYAGCGSFVNRLQIGCLSLRNSLGKYLQIIREVGIVQTVSRHPGAKFARVYFVCGEDARVPFCSHMSAAGQPMVTTDGRRIHLKSISLKQLNLGLA